jgi:hypothetical protein
VKINLSKRPFLAAAVLGAAAVLVIGTFVALEVRSVVAGPDAAAPAAAPTPVGHEWSQVEGHGTGTGLWWLGTTVNQALELRVNNARALRLEPNTVSPNVIGGYSGNSATTGVRGAAIGGGGATTGCGGVPFTDPCPNRVTDDYGTVAGGRNNQAGDNLGTTSDRSYASVGGGNHNTASALYATVGGGTSNTASGQSATVAGGGSNAASADYATVGGGGVNTANGYAATVGGGYDNAGSGTYSTVGGGWTNFASADYATIAGGGRSDPANNDTANRVTDNYGTVSGGGNNQAGNGAGTTADNVYATVGGGAGNTALATSATVGGGAGNTASGLQATVGGGYINDASGMDATVGGGVHNTASGLQATVGGGYFNDATAQDATVGGGNTNAANSLDATVGGGYNNVASGQFATVGGGNTNAASAAMATVGGGRNNSASYEDATVGGGIYNTASGNNATVPGGIDNEAGGFASFAAGRRAKANSQGCFVWGDSTYADVACNTNDRFIARASGGVYLYTNSTLTSGAYLAAGSGSWSSVSDRNLKDNFTPVDGQEVLASLADIPITTWNYKAQDAATRHMGPVAQDFYAAFGLGESDTAISTVDADGVALAAIQGLYQLSQDQAGQIAAQQEQIQALEQAQGANGSGLTGGPLSSALTPGWLLLGGLFVAGLVVVQRWRAGGRR